ncbi:hypothetical protein PSACC_00007 [Paramicrosporidium saccamoebae]|uniref:Uncharacterized protein n=1 Tax=Paramicrosporidium saccamoebae TaxID=1246581 RepID=A0A2H9TR47_9FUNG|nr:hypothetical protein PSACC_00007 [Paramicrosporidium saccamoebae]
MGDGDLNTRNAVFPAQPGHMPPSPPPPPPPPPPGRVPTPTSTGAKDRVEVPRLKVGGVRVPHNVSLEGTLYTRTKRLSKKAIQAYEKSFTVLRGELEKQEKMAGPTTVRETVIIDHKRRQPIEIQMMNLCKAAYGRRECTISELMTLMISRDASSFDGYSVLLPKRDMDCPKLEDDKINPEKLSIHEKFFRAECQSEALWKAAEYHDKKQELLETLDNLILDSATCHQTIGIVVGNKGLEALVRKARETLKHSGTTFYSRDAALYDYIPLKVLLEPMAQLASRRTKKTYLDFVVEQLVQDNQTTQLMLTMPDQMDRLTTSGQLTGSSQLKTASQIECTNLASRVQAAKTQVELFLTLLETLREKAAESDDPLNIELLKLVEEGQAYQDTWSLNFPKLWAQIDEFMAHWSTVETYLLHQPILCPMKEPDVEIPKTLEERYNNARLHQVPSGFQPCKGQKTSNRLLYLTLGVIGELVRSGWMKMIDELEDGETRAIPKKDLLSDLLQTPSMTTGVTKTTQKSTKSPKTVKSVGVDAKRALKTAYKKPDTTEIDELFSTRSVDTVKTTQPTSAKNTQPINAKNTQSLNTTGTPRPKDDIGDTRGKKKKARPLTDDGLPIFTAEEMGLNKGGDTADCPFDCSCCF